LKYMLLIYSGEGCMTEAERAACMAESLRVCDDLKAKGQFIDAAPLQPVATASTVRVRNGRQLVTAGPFAETVEQLGGFYMLELPDLDTVIAVAAKLPPVTKGTVEIRPVLAMDGLPPARPHECEGGDAPYLLLAYHDEAAWEKAGADARREGSAAAVALAHDLAAGGDYFSAAPLHPSATATSVRVRDGRRLITDGPFAETTEVLGGYFLVRAADRVAALAVAARFNGSCGGSVEVRQLFDLTPVREKIAANP